MKKSIFLLFAVTVLFSCSESITLNENKIQVNEKILSLESAETIDDFLQVYEYIVTEKDYLDAMEILERNNKTHLLEHLFVGNPETITLRSGEVVQELNNEYYYQGDIVLTQRQLDLLSDPNYQMIPVTIDRENSIESIYAAMNERYPDIYLPEFEEIKKNVEQYEIKDYVSSEVITRGAGLIGVPFMLYVWASDCPYIINSSFSSAERLFIQDAINTWNANSKKTGITLVQKTNQTDYVEFVHGTGNTSNVGKVGGRQKITLVQNGFSRGNVLHEIGHAFGLFHEHSKENRDNHIIVNWSNIEPGQSHNFERKSHSCAQFDNFDFRSVMLYSSDAWSKNGQPTLTRNDANRTTWQAQRSYLSDDDINIITKMKEYSVIATYVWFMTGGMP